MEHQTIKRGVYLIMALFCLQPMALGAWLALIPFIKETLELSKFDMSLSLLGMPVAVLIALQFAGGISTRIGIRRLLVIMFPLQCLAGFLPILAGGQVMLFFALAAFGTTHAFMEVGLNVYAGRVEKRAAAHIMNRCHGFWALGLMAGSFIATSAAGAIGSVGVMAVVAVGSTILGVILARQMPKMGEEGAEHVVPRRRVSEMPGALLAIGAFMFLVTLAEGAMSDWSAVYLSERQSIDVTEAGIAVTIFAGFMAFGRFCGDWLKHRFGALMLARVSVVLAIAGLSLLVAPLPLAAAFVGFAFVGMGVASGYPLGVSAVAALDDRNEAANVAIMSTCALTGFLVGPPVIGFLSDVYSIRIGLGAMIPGLIACLLLAKWLIPSESETTRP
ncbi:MAG: MFS transporter [Boseongicola sp.]|nr:MFS transporter [Boseongicola sp.]